MMKFIAFFSVLFTCAACEPRISDNQQRAIAQVLDGWHASAAAADSNAYFGAMAPGSIFMGTDDSEYWTRETFQTWARPYFKRGKAWNFKAKERNIYFDASGHTAWFDEKLDTPNMGPCRGSGVVMLQSGRWMIKHYNLSIPIPNAISDTVVHQVKVHLASGGASS
jgi:hypothetical protein